MHDPLSRYTSVLDGGTEHSHSLVWNTTIEEEVSMHCERTEGPKREDERTTFLSEGERENEEERAQKRRKGGNFPKGSAEEELADVPLFGSNRAQVDLSEWNCTATEEKKKSPFLSKEEKKKA